MRSSWRAAALVPFMVGLGVLLAPQAAAQGTQVTTQAAQVVVEGDHVRLRSGGQAVTISSDWRHAVKVTVGDVDRILADLGAVVTQDRVQLNLADDILFPFDSAEVRSEAAATLARVAAVIRARSVGDVYVFGHTDSIGTAAYNAELSLKRAVAVMRWLNQHEGIPAAILVGRGLGASQPIAHNTNPDGSDNPAGRARNRRVEVQLATREGVTIKPGLITAGGVTVSEQGVTAGGVTVKAGGGVELPAPGAGTCAQLCDALATRASIATIGCMEGSFEELGFEMDSDPCDDLEDAMAMGGGSRATSLCLACQRAEGFDDKACSVVMKACLR